MRRGATIRQHSREKSRHSRSRRRTPAASAWLGLALGLGLGLGFGSVGIGIDTLEELDDVKDFLGSCLAPALSLEEASALSAGKIKKLLLSKGVDITGCLEKADLIEKLKTLY